MADPAGKQNQFTATVNGSPATINSLNLKTGDPYSIIVTLATPLTGSETVYIAYTAGDVASVQGGWLLSFTDQLVTLTAQTINFSQSLTKKYNESPMTLTATASSGLGITYSSSNLSVATVSGNVLSFHSVGNSDITAMQLGNAAYAPAKYIKTLTVSKGDQVITFTTLPAKTYGDADFNISATASSGLSVSFSSGNTGVATIAGSTVHVVGGGESVITASQAGNSLWNPAPVVPQTLTVSKAPLTVTADNKTKAYLAPLPTLTFTITGFLFSDDQSVLNILPDIQTPATQNSSVGDYEITISGGIDNSYYFNTYVPGTLTITKISQTITFTAFPERLLVNNTFTLAASSTSGLTVSFESLNPTIATVSGTTLTGVSKGTAQIRAYNAGNVNYNAAEILAPVEVFSTHRYIMHLFTPNNDGINDYWELPDMDVWGKSNVKVYNRWGKLVFAKDNYDNLWDGTSNGNPLPEGAYYFVIKTENSGTITGTVNIIR
ncbi:MAG: gliding motility-associated C-terminal domain-containing protein [Bacteroidales bacterium]|nr:gliding motility-associated C-terminal domain-containing protein [Bacteroidales bacterium]